MILINGVKYACMECVRGHRSSSCKHHTRPLLQVRSKGRPNVYANGNPNHRIAVFAQEIAKDIEEDEDIQLNKCNKNPPVIILKASPKQVIDLVSGLIVGPYDESNSQPCNVKQTNTVTTPIINGNSFINTSSCCGAVSSVSKSCGCCVNKRKPVNKSKILESYLKKRIENQIKYQPKPGWTFVNEYLPDEDLTVKQEEKPPMVTDPQLFDVVSIPSCSIPGTCSCDDNCSCAGCIVHGNSKTNDFSKYLPLSESNLEFNNMLTQNVTYPISQNQYSTPNAISNIPNNIPNITSSPDNFIESPKCNCPTDSCDCTNCETHGRINGYKLDDFFQKHNINEYQNYFLGENDEEFYNISLMKQENDLLFDQLLKSEPREQPEEQVQAEGQVQRQPLLLQQQQQQQQQQQPQQHPHPHPHPLIPQQLPQAFTNSCCSNH